VAMRSGAHAEEAAAGAVGDAAVTAPVYPHPAGVGT
jgi:hypothetical protein